jgi:hypothetical protein
MFHFHCAGVLHSHFIGTFLTQICGQNDGPSVLQAFLQPLILLVKPLLLFFLSLPFASQVLSLIQLSTLRALFLTRVISIYLKALVLRGLSFFTHSTREFLYLLFSRHRVRCQLIYLYYPLW